MILCISGKPLGSGGMGRGEGGFEWVNSMNVNLKAFLINGKPARDERVNIWNVQSSTLFFSMTTVSGVWSIEDSNTPPSDAEVDVIPTE